MPSLRMSENWTEPSRVMEPGKVMPSSWTIMPRNAIMEMRPCLISARAAAGEALRVLEHEAARAPRPGVDADVALDDDLGGGCEAGRHEGDGRGGEEGESELGHFDLLVLRAREVGRVSHGVATARVHRGGAAAVRRAARSRARA